MKKILIIEDNIAMCQVLERIVTEIGNIEYKTVKDGKEAVNIYKNFQPDLIITDITLPNKTGVEIVKEIKEQNKEIKIIFCSAWINKKIIEETKNLGIMAYISKPFNINEIMTTIKKSLQL